MPIGLSIRRLESASAGGPSQVGSRLNFGARSAIDGREFGLPQTAGIEIGQGLAPGLGEDFGGNPLHWP